MTQTRVQDKATKPKAGEGDREQIKEGGPGVILEFELYPKGTRIPKKGFQQ